MDDQTNLPSQGNQNNPSAGSNGGSDDAAVPGSGQSDSGQSPTPKKPKTEAQRERERARRRRRRKKKTEQPPLQPGQDVPLILSEDKLPPPSAAQPELQPPLNVGQPLPESDQSFEQEQPENQPREVQPVETDASPIQPEDTGPSTFLPAEPEPILPEPQSEPQTKSQPESIFPGQPEIQPPSERYEVRDSYRQEEDEEEDPSEATEPSEEAEVTTMDESQEIFEEKHQQESLDQAKQISDQLLQEESSVLDELPQRQDLFGKFFNFLERLVHGRKSQVKVEVASITSTPVQETVTEYPRGPGIIMGLLRTLASLLVLGLLLVGAYWVGSSLHITDRVREFFTPKPGMELVNGDNQQVVVDEEMLNKWGFRTALYFGQNAGDVRDMTYNIFFNSNYFGKLKDPMFIGETGISAAIYYGFGKEALYIKNRFINYVNYLAKIRLANQVKIADVLDNQLHRDQVLDKYLADTRAIFDEGNKLRREINVQIDDLKISVNSLNADKDRYETDFFVALDQTQGEKSELLINKFIDSSQQQIKLKAQLAALSSLSASYEADLITMKIKLDDISKNREALISGVTVTEVQGSDLNLIRR
jgi:hypothetical protein